MSATVDDPMDLIREAVETQRARQGSVKAAIAAVARLVGMKARRVEAVWWSQPVRLDWQEAERVRAALAEQWRREMAETEARQKLLRARLDALGDMHVPMADGDGAPAILARSPSEGAR